MAEEVRMVLAEPVELVEEIVELLEEPELMVQLVEGAERNQRVAQPELAQAAVPEDPAQVERQTKVVPAAAIVVAVAVAVSGVEVAVAVRMMVLLVEVVAQVSELSEQPAQAQLRGTAAILTVALPVKEARVVAAARVVMETLAAS